MRVMEKMTKNHETLVSRLTKGLHEMSGYFNTGHLASKKKKPKTTQEVESYEEIRRGLVAGCL